jgi:hypothetical protein
MICFSSMENYFLFILHVKIYLTIILTKYIFFKSTFKSIVKSIFLKSIFLNHKNDYNYYVKYMFNWLVYHLCYYFRLKYLKIVNTIDEWHAMLWVGEKNKFEPKKLCKWCIFIKLISKGKTYHLMNVLV